MISFPNLFYLFFITDRIEPNLIEQALEHRRSLRKTVSDCYQYYYNYIFDSTLRTRFGRSTKIEDKYVVLAHALCCSKYYITYGLEIFQSLQLGRFFLISLQLSASFLELLGVFFMFCLLRQ